MERKIKLNTSNKVSTRKITTLAMLSAISVILGFTPLGIIPVPPVPATIMHIPVIIAAILEGPIIGAIMGFIFGIISIVRAITTGNLLLVAYLNPLVSVLPRILIGVVAYYVYKGIPIKNEKIRVGLSAAVGTAINTIGFLGMMYLLYANEYSVVKKISQDTVAKVMVAVAMTNGIPEIIVAVIITVGVIMALKKVRKN